MLCQNCEKNEATTHIKQIINGDMTETHLCSECAKLLGANDMFSDFNLNISEFFSNFFGDMLPTIGQGTALRCKKCGCTFDDIVRDGKLGCAQCYDTFYDRLLPSLQRIHGKIRHSGKISRCAGQNEAPSDNAEASAPPAPEQPAQPQTAQSRIEALKSQMNEAVAQQNFELAAQLRDEIKALEGGESK